MVMALRCCKPALKATVTAAILDRLGMNAIRIDIDGPSYRQHIADARAADRTSSSSESPAKR